MSISSKKVRGTVAAVLAVVFCPCHLVLTLPLVLTLLGSSAGGLFLSSHSGLLFGLFAVLFVGALFFAYRSFGSLRGEPERAPACDVPKAKNRSSATVEIGPVERIRGGTR